MSDFLRARLSQWLHNAKPRVLTGLFAVFGPNLHSVSTGSIPKYVGPLGLGVPDSPRVDDLPLMATYAKKSENDENSCIPAKPVFREALAD